MEPHWQLWLATPAAAERFDADSQAFEDLRRWRRMRLEAARADWQVSRALLAHAAAGGRARSLSHSQGYAALAVAPEGTRVGVDLEYIDPCRDHLRLARFGFTADEAAQLEALQGAARAEHFYVLWTLKEACIKALRLTLLDGLRRCTFTADGGVWRAVIPAAGRWSAQVFHPVPSHYLAVVTEGETRWEQQVWPGPVAQPWRQVVRIIPDGP